MTTTDVDRLVVPHRREPVGGTDAGPDLLRWPRPPQEQPASPKPDENAAARSPSLMLLVMLAALGIVAYAWFLFDPTMRGDFLPWIMVVVAETVLVTQALFSMWTILSSGYDPRDFAFHAAQDRLFDPSEVAAQRAQQRPEQWRLFLRDKPVTVDVFITTCGEPLAVIERTVRAALAIRGEHRTWLLDDGRSDAVRDLAARLGARYVRRLSSGGAKAGNVNHALTIAKGDFFVILDADFVPEPDFLLETVPFFAKDDVAFVQTPQTYGNMHSVISRGAGYMQAVFYRFMQPGRNRFNAAFSVGTNVIFRRAAIDTIGGMYTDSKSEDVWTSIKLHEQGWRSVYIPLTLAVGDTPETIESYSKQQLRWATGGFEILLRYNPFSRRRRLTLDQRLQYFVTATHYLSGMVPALLLLIPPLQVFLDLTPIETISPARWFLYYCGFYLMQVAIAFFTLGSFRWEVLLLSSVSFPIYLKAFWNALTEKQQAWSVTGARGGRTTAFDYMVPQVLIFLFLLLTSVVGLWRSWGGAPSVALVWNMANTLILGLYVLTGVRETAAVRRGERAVKGRRKAERTGRRAPLRHAEVTA